MTAIMNPPRPPLESINQRNLPRYLEPELEWQHFKHRGFQRYTELNAAIHPDSHDASHFGSYHTDYRTAQTSIVHVHPDLPDLITPFTHLNINPQTPLLKTELLTSLSKGIVHETAVSSPAGVLIALTSFAALDTTPPGPRKLPWSELAWQLWAGAAGSYARLRGLRCIVRHAISNPATRRVIAMAHRRLGLDPGVGQQFALGGAGPSEEEEEGVREAFLALLGTDNGSSTVRLLVDHAGALGKKRVERVLTWPGERGPVMVFVLSESLCP